MASELKVDKFTGVTTAGSILVTGEGNSTTTNLQQGLCKTWYDVNGSGTAAISDSLNGASITDHGTGDYTISRTNAMSNLTYAVGGHSDFDNGNQRGIIMCSNETPTNRSTTVMRHALQNSAGNGQDPAHFSAVIFGDLA